RPQKRCCGSAFAFSPIRVLSSCTPIEVFVISSVPLLVRGTSTSRAPLHAGARTPVAAPLQASVAPRYRRFFAPTDPAATLRPSAPLPTPTLLRGLSPRHREGFPSFDPPLRCVLPSLPRRNRPRLSASVLPRPMLPSPFHERLGFRPWSHGACSTFDACGPQRRFPALQPDLTLFVEGGGSGSGDLGRRAALRGFATLRTLVVEAVGTVGNPQGCPRAGGQARLGACPLDRQSPQPPRGGPASWHGSCAAPHGTCLSQAKAPPIRCPRFRRRAEKGRQAAADVGRRDRPPAGRRYWRHPRVLEGTGCPKAGGPREVGHAQRRTGFGCTPYRVLRSEGRPGGRSRSGAKPLAARLAARSEVGSAEVGFEACREGWHVHD